MTIEVKIKNWKEKENRGKKKRITAIAGLITGGDTRKLCLFNDGDMLVVDFTPQGFDEFIIMATNAIARKQPN